MEPFAPYAHAIAAMAGMGLLTLVMSPLSAMKKSRLGLAPGSEPAPDYTSATYRWHRAYGNAAESTGTFALVTAAAILAGGGATWVNWLASLYLLSRIVLAVVHVRGIGKPDMSVRSFIYVFGWLMSVLLALTAIIAAI
ncbi:MAPEG family protein [Roseovarius sp. SCSIO 43702]|uniref:MAPEG family protein n=1 Tax=Roseovarius sp. SCSIO 43702 TaxID=2823043 RepID=UPI001C730E9F|nr:MAPEG family protein [Roseovarius sp. SCSIO 43702]QYX55622.1 MAPEG family protein [Roseovarius sp. SCSIO 43702]